MDRQEGASLRDILQIVFRRIYILKIVMAVIPVAALIAAYLVTPVYRTSAKVLVTAKKENTSLLMGGKETGSTSIFSLNVDETDVNSEMELIQSRDLWKETVEKLGVGYFKEDKKGGLAPLSGLVSGLWDKPAAPRTKGGKPLSPEAMQLEATIAALVRSCRVVPVPKSKVIEIELDYNDPAKAQEILSTHLAQYIPYHLHVHSSPGAQTFFTGQGDVYKKKFEDASNRVIEFKRQWGISSPDKQKEGLIQLIAQVKDALIQINANVSQFRNMLSSLERNVIPSGQLASTLRKGDENTVINVIAAQLIRAQQKDLEARETFAGQSRDYRASQEMVEALTVKLRETLKVELANLEVTKTSLENDLKRNEESLALLEERTEESRRLEIEANIAKDRYVQYATRGEDARVEKMMEGKQLVSVRIVSEPFLPEAPVFPRKALMFLGAILLAFPLGLGMILTANFLDRTFDSPHDVEAATRQKVLASLKRIQM
jgi:uncharacterized protein involved in exopolysaccharide biosynthesis